MENKDFEYDYSDKVLSESDARATKGVLSDFVKSYCHTKGTASDEEWLSRELAKHLPERSQEEIAAMSREIIDSLRATQEKHASLKNAVKSGRSKESWVASSLMGSASLAGGKKSAQYLIGLDSALKQANERTVEAITRQDGSISMNPCLDGFIAEQYHVNSFNLNAQAKGSQLRAEVLKPEPGKVYSKNSVDIAIKDASGKIVNKYQAKYGATADITIQLIKNGDYRGQQLVVPAEQVEAVQKAFPNRKVSAFIGYGDVQSNVLTKGQAKDMQEKAQAGLSLDADWNEYAMKDVAMGIGKNAAYSCLQGAAIGVGMNLVSKVWNGEEIHGEELVETALTTGADFGVKTALAGGLKVATEKGFLPIIAKGTSGNVFANIAFVAVENAKVLKKMATGDLTLHEGIEEMQQTTGACVAGIAASVKGAAIGSTVGAVFGPVGWAVGGFVGGTVGYMAGSKVGRMVVRGIQKVCGVAKSAIKEGFETVKEWGSNLWSRITSVLA